MINPIADMTIVTLRSVVGRTEGELDNQDRPITIVAFEVANIASIVLTMVLTHSGSPFEELFTSAAWVALTLWITRGGSRVARIIYTALAVIGAAALFAAYWFDYVPISVATLLAVRITIELGILLALLWWPSSNLWFRRPVQPTAP